MGRVDRGIVTRLLCELGRLVEVGDRLRPAWALTIIVGLSLAVKLAYIALPGGGLAAFPTEGTDALVFDRAAHVLLAGGGYALTPGQPMLQPPPGEAFLLALLYAVSAGSLAFAKLAHVALLTGAAALTYLTGRQLFTPAVGLWAGCCYGLHRVTAVKPLGKAGPCPKRERPGTRTPSWWSTPASAWRARRKTGICFRSCSSRTGCGGF